jgi:hypothetical protein
VKSDFLCVVLYDVQSARVCFQDCYFTFVSALFRVDL